MMPSPRLLGFGFRALNDRPPAGNFALHQRSEWLLTSLCRGRNGAAYIGKASARGVVVECLVERIGELVEDRLWYAFWRKQAVPRRSYKLRQPGLQCCRNIRQRRVTFSRRYCISLDRSGLNLLTDITDAVQHVVDLTADQRIRSGRSTSERHHGRLYTKP